MAAASDTETGLVLYGTSACHLCEIAQDMLDSHNAHSTRIHYSVSDISASEELFQRYGVRIPVLRRSDGAELNWPFSIEQLNEFLA